MSKPSSAELRNAKRKFEWGSQVILQHPWLKWLVVGEDYPARIFTIAETSADAVRWERVEGDKKSGRLPRNYHGAAIFSVPTESWRKQKEDRPGSVYAGAFTVGNVVVLTTISDLACATAAKDAPNVAAVDAVFRIGKYDLSAILGVYQSSDRSFEANPDAGLFEVVLANEVAQKYPHALLL